MADDYFWFELVHEADGRTHTVQAHGELDIVHAQRFRDALLGIGGPTVVVELSDVTFIDARGLAALMGVHAGIKARGDRFRVKGARGHVRRVIDLCDAEFLYDD